MTDRLRHQATWLMSRANLRAHTLLQQAFSAADSRPYFYRIMATLESADRLSQADIGRATGLDRSDVTNSLRTLEAQGFIARESDSTDGRRMLVRLTPAGHRELDRLAAVLASVQEEFLAPLTPSERQTLTQLLDRLG
ncbi:MarR family transcriptional regulator [Gordonia sp. NPDC003585]|uniref:MarR family winged helix-turn-helix transcriptional regulator n=1 Tax=unclassified Gordonia (in: high G+C Gram-positive bacteria) TaxID=2657482 RepID=UPI0033B0057E